MDSSKLRDTIILSLKKEGLESLAVVKIDGNYFSAVDVALKDGEVYRIGVIKHSQNNLNFA